MEKLAAAKVITFYCFIVT